MTTQEAGRKGRQANTEAQKLASRENGKKGGRPKGSKNKPKPAREAERKKEE